MQTNSNTLQVNTFFLTIVFLSISILSTAIGNEEKAKELFKNQEYATALPLFEELNTLYPSDASFQYYYGVCLTQTGKYGTHAKKLLLLAAQNNVPFDVFFYIGKNYHALNDFTTAKSYYDRFSENAKKKEKKALKLQENIEYCQNEINPYHKTTTKEKISPPSKAEELTSASSLANQKDSLTTQNESKKINIVQEDLPIEKPLIVPQELKDSIFDFILTSDICYHQIEQFRTYKGKKLFIEGWKNTNQLKQKLIQTKQLRRRYELEKSMVKKDQFAQQLIDMELEIFQLKSNSDQHYMQSRKEEIEYWNKASDDEQKELKHENAELQAKRQKETIVQKHVIVPSIKVDTIKNVSKLEIEETKKDETLKDNQLRYKVQIGAYSKGLPVYIERLYKKLSYLRKIDHYTDDRGVVVYTVGEVSNFEDAIKLQHQIRQEGVKDAFVVAYYNGKRITLSEAKEISKQ